MRSVFILFMLPGLSLKSQQLKNAGFETWNNSSKHFLPVNWSVDLDAALHHSPYSHAQEGKYALVLSTWYSYVEGHLYYGSHKIVHKESWTDYAVPFTGRPLKLTGWYRYKDTVNPTDSAGGQIILKDMAGDTLAYGTALLGTAINWTRFVIPLNYRSNKKTASIAIHFISREVGGGMNDDSYPNRLYLDNFKLQYKKRD